MWITKRVDDKTSVTYGVGWLYTFLGLMTIGYLGQTGTLVTFPLAVAVVWGVVKWVERRRANRAKTGSR